MSGPGAATYAPVIDAMKAYLEHVNRKGGVNGKPVRIMVQDNQGDPARAAADARKLLTQDRAILLINSSLSSTFAPVVAEARRANVPLYYAGAVCPKDTYPPADRCNSTAFGANLDSQAALASSKEFGRAVRLGLAAIAIPIARTEIDYAEALPLRWKTDHRRPRQTSRRSREAEDSNRTGFVLVAVGRADQDFRGVAPAGTDATSPGAT
jgi:hypothetical protein